MYGQVEREQLLPYKKNSLAVLEELFSLVLTENQILVMKELTRDLTYENSVTTYSVAGNIANLRHLISLGLSVQVPQLS